MKYFKLIEELDIDGDKNPDGFLINLCTLDKNNNIIYLKSKYLTFLQYNKLKLKKGGVNSTTTTNPNTNIIIHRSMLIKNPNIITIITTANPNHVVVIVDDDDKNDKEKDDKNLPDKKELTPAQLRDLAQKTINSDNTNQITPEIKRQLITIANSKNDKDLMISELEKKIDTIDRDNQNQRINDIKQMQMIQHMQLMNISNQVNNNNNNNNTTDNSFSSYFMSGLGFGIGAGVARLLLGSFMSHPYYSYDYGFGADYYYPNYYENTTIIEQNYFTDNSTNIDVNGEVGDVGDFGGDFGDVGDFGGDFDF